MFPRNENRNEGTFAKTTLLRNLPFISQWALTLISVRKWTMDLESASGDVDECPSIFALWSLQLAPNTIEDENIT